MEQTLDTTSTSPSKKRQISTGLLISFITLIIILGVFELIAYLWERNMAQDELGWTLVASRRMPVHPRGPENGVYTVLEPNKEYVWEGIPVTINSRGFRTEEFDIPKPADKYRILNIGDSVVFGWEVEQEATYGKQMERMLNAQNDSLEYEVINAGVPGWNLATEVNFLEQEGVTYDPDMIILNITLVNDVYANDPLGGSSQNLSTWLRDNTYTYPFLTIQTRFLLAQTTDPRAFQTLNPPLDAAKYFPLELDSPVWTRLWERIKKMDDIAKELDIPFLLIVFPTAFQLNSIGHPDIPQQVLGEKARMNGIELIDMLPVYEEVCAEAESGACEGFENLLFADVWMHPNEFGHKLAAEALLARD